MKKIIFVTNFFGNGGAARVMSTLIEYFNKESTEIEVVSFLDRKDTYKIPQNVKYTTLKYKKRGIKKIQRIKQLRKIFKKNPDATIISFESFVNMQTILASIGLKNKVIVSERNDPAIYGKKKIKKILRNILYKQVSTLVCQTPDAKEYFPKKIQDKTVVIPNPIMEGLPEKYNGVRRKIIVNFCRIEPQKNLKLLIDAFIQLHKEFPEYKLNIYGDGAAKNEIKNYIKEQNMDQHVILYDFIQNIHEEIVDNAMFVSSSDYEGISNSMLEAMAMGLPVVVTNCPCGGAKMFVKNNENGILVDVRDKEALYEGMKKIITDNIFAEKISNEAIKIKEELNSDKISKKWIERI